MPDYYQKNIKPLSRKLFAADRILQRQYGAHKSILAYVRDNIGLTLSESDYSKILRAHKNREFISKKLQRNLQEISEILVELLRDRFKYFWNETDKEFTQDPNFRVDLRIEAFHGTYIAYNWDEGSFINTGIAHIHRFKMRFNRDEIHCHTKDSELKGYTILPITSDRIAVEISSSHRKVFIIIYLGNAPYSEIKQKEYFKAAYVDSGTDDIKTGLAIFERTDIDYHSLKSETLPLSELEGKINPSYVTILDSAQKIL